MEHKETQNYLQDADLIETKEDREYFGDMQIQ